MASNLKAISVGLPLGAANYIYPL